MIIKVPGEINVAVPAAKAWRVLAHEYVNIGNWNSAIPVSKAVGSEPSFEGAPAGGRLCSTNVPGFGGITEELKHYLETDTPHPRKQQQLDKARMAPLV